VGPDKDCAVCGHVYSKHVLIGDATGVTAACLECAVHATVRNEKTPTCDAGIVARGVIEYLGDKTPDWLRETVARG